MNCNFSCLDSVNLSLIQSFRHQENLKKNDLRSVTTYSQSIAKRDRFQFNYSDKSEGYYNIDILTNFNHYLILLNTNVNRHWDLRIYLTDIKLLLGDVDHLSI